MEKKSSAKNQSESVRCIDKHRYIIHINRSRIDQERASFFLVFSQLRMFLMENEWTHINQHILLLLLIAI